MAVMLNPQYVIDRDQKPKVGHQDTIPFEQAVREIEEESK
jgi:hypothetical protein